MSVKIYCFSYAVDFLIMSPKSFLLCTIYCLVKLEIKVSSFTTAVKLFWAWKYNKKFNITFHVKATGETWSFVIFSVEWWKASPCTHSFRWEHHREQDRTREKEGWILHADISQKHCFFSFPVCSCLFSI